MVAVCSVDKDEVLEQLGVRTTTNPIQLALWAGSGSVVVFATYASLVDREDPADVTLGIGLSLGRWSRLWGARSGCTGSGWPLSTWPFWTKGT